MNLKRFNSSSMVIAGLFGAGIFLASSVSAVEEPITVECPLGGGVANGIETLGMVVTNKGLDGRLYGPHTEAHPPPECVDNGFLVYKNDFSETELLHLEKYISSEEYQRMWRSGVPAFYRLAKTYEYLEYPIVNYAYLYLMATWKFRDAWSGGASDMKKDSYEHYAREAISAFILAVDQMQLNPYRNQKRLVQFHYLLTELYRRVGEFESAEQTLNWLRQTELDASFIHWTVIEFQDHLISKKDSDHHMMSEI